MDHPFSYRFLGLSEARLCSFSIENPDGAEKPKDAAGEETNVEGSRDGALDSIAHGLQDMSGDGIEAAKSMVVEKGENADEKKTWTRTSEDWDKMHRPKEIDQKKIDAYNAMMAQGQAKLDEIRALERKIAREEDPEARKTMEKELTHLRREKGELLFRAATTPKPKGVRGPSLQEQIDARDKMAAEGQTKQDAIRELKRKMAREEDPETRKTMEKELALLQREYGELLFRFSTTPKPKKQDDSQ